MRVAGGRPTPSPRAQARRTLWRPGPEPFCLLFFCFVLFACPLKAFSPPLIPCRADLMDIVAAWAQGTKFADISRMSAVFEVRPIVFGVCFE